MKNGFRNIVKHLVFGLLVNEVIFYRRGTTTGRIVFNAFFKT